MKILFLVCLITVVLVFSGCYGPVSSSTKEPSASAELDSASAIASLNESPATPNSTTCPDGTIVITLSDCPKQKCSDGTEYGACSQIKPNYCKDGNFVYDAAKCGCPSEYTPDSNGITCISKPMSLNTSSQQTTNPTVQVYSCPDGSIVALQSDCPKQKKDTIESKEFVSVSSDISNHLTYSTSDLSYVNSKMPTLQQDINKLKASGYDTRAEQYVYDVIDASVASYDIATTVTSDLKSANNSYYNSDYASAKVYLNKVIQNLDSISLIWAKIDAYPYSVTDEAKRIYNYNRSDTSAIKSSLADVKAMTQKTIEILNTQTNTATSDSVPQAPQSDSYPHYTAQPISEDKILVPSVQSLLTREEMGVINKIYLEKNGWGDYTWPMSSDYSGCESGKMINPFKAVYSPINPSISMSCAQATPTSGNGALKMDFPLGFGIHAYQTKEQASAEYAVLAGEVRTNDYYPLLPALSVGNERVAYGASRVGSIYGRQYSLNFRRNNVLVIIFVTANDDTSAEKVLTYLSTLIDYKLTSSG